MFHIINDRKKAERAHLALRKEFQKGAEKINLLLSTPGLQIHDALVFFRRDLDLWAYFSNEPDQRGLLLCWLGVGEPTWRPAIEINIPVRRTLHCYTQLLADEREDVCLAHKGGLGGGKNTVAPGAFGDLINGFQREPVQDGANERHYFVLGRFSQSAELLQQLSKYVHEAESIRKLRSNRRKFTAALEAAGGLVRNGKAIGGDEYTGEATGGGSYLVHRQVTFDRVHAEVQRALARELQKRQLKYGNRRQKHGLGPDLYVRDRHGRMAHLFEIKVGQDAQSTFTALGQLLVYSADENPAPSRTLVTRGLPQSVKFKTAIEAQAIKVLHYRLGDRPRVKFDNLDEILR